MSETGMLKDWLTEGCGLGEGGMRLWVGDTFDSCVVGLNVLDGTEK